MGEFSIWHWLVLLIIGGFVYAAYRATNPKQVRPIHTQAVMSGENLMGARKLFFIALGIDMSVIALIAASAFWTIGVLNEVQSGSRIITQSFLSTLEFWENFSRLAIVTLIGVGLALVKWLNSCYRYAGSIGATGFKHEGWTAAGWIIPFFNLFKPYQVISEIYKAGALGYRSADDWKKEEGSGLLMTWWIFWVTTHLIVWMLFKVVIWKSYHDDLTLPQVVGLYDMQAWICVISLIVAGLWFVVVDHLTERLLRRPSLQAGKNAEMGASPIPVPAATQSIVAAQVSAIGTNHSQARGAADELSLLQNDVLARPASDNTVDEEAIYAAIADEVENGKVHKGLWTKLWVEAEGDEKKVKLAYIKARLFEISAEQELAARIAEQREKDRKDAQWAAVQQAQENEKILKEKNLVLSKEKQRIDIQSKLENAISVPNTEIEAYANILKLSGINLTKDYFKCHKCNYYGPVEKYKVKIGAISNTVTSTSYRCPICNATENVVLM